MDKPHSQSMRLESWRKLNRPKQFNDPNFGGLKKLDQELRAYLMHSSELFISARIYDKPRHLRLQISIPEKEGTEEESASLERFFK